jgi:probable phosphoglycerate mutase
VFEGLMYREVAEQYPQEFALWQARDLHARFPAGEREAETLHDFHQRSVNAVTNIVKNHPEQRMLILTHGGVLDCLYREATGMPVDAKREFGIINAAINRLHWDGKKYTILQWADATHLEGDGLDEIDRTHPAA